MSIKKLIIVILVMIIAIAGFVFYQYQNHHKKENEKIPVLLYHNFVSRVPESDPDNFNYINTPQSFEENMKVLLENGYTVLSMQELDDS